MKERSRAHLPTALSVDTFYSVYHLDLTKMNARGELHDFYELVYVESGYYYVLLDGERYTVPLGSVIFFAPNTFHSGDGTTKVTATVDILSFDAQSPLMHCFDNRCIPLDDLQKDAFFRVFEMAQRFIVRHPHGGICTAEDASAYELQKLKNRFELFLLDLYDEQDAPAAPSNRKQYRKAQFRRVSDFLKQNLERNLTLEALASECSMSVSGLKALCREFCGCGPIDYWISLRITAAKELIRESTMNFTEIAEKTGFSSLHYFSRIFKARTGMTPSEYAKAP